MTDAKSTKEEDTKQIRRYHRQYRYIRIRTNDPEKIAEYRSKQPTYEQRIEVIGRFAKSILNKNKPNGTPESNYDLARRIVSQIRMNASHGVSPLRCIKIGMLYERLLSGLFWDSGRKKPRMDELSKAMWKTMERFIQEEARLPSAKELWHALPEGRHIQEKADDTIFWKRSSGKEEETAFKLFQDRYTTLRKKIKNR